MCTCHFECGTHCGTTAEQSSYDPESTFIQRAGEGRLIIFPCLAAFSSSPSVKNSLYYFHSGFELTTAVKGPYVSHFGIVQLLPQNVRLN